MLFFSKEKALYKACGEKLEENRECNKKVVENESIITVTKNSF